MTSYVDTAAGPTVDSVPGRAELVGRAEALREVLREDAPECDRLRRLTGRSFDGLVSAGLTRLMTPRRLGGYQTDMVTFLDVTTEIGRGCCASAWIAGVLNAGNFVASLFPEHVQDEIWAGNPDATCALVLGAPRAQVEQADGGIVITGQWPYTSGSLHCDWVLVMIPRSPGSDEPMVSLALLPIGDTQVQDTWHFAGMRGTGSNTVVAERVFVPSARVIPFMPLLNGGADAFADSSHRYRNSLMGLFSIGLLGAQLGGAQAALEIVREAAAKRPVAATTYPNQAEAPTFQLDLAHAATTIDSAKLLAGRIAATVDSYAARDEMPDLEIRARARADSTYVTEQCRHAIDTLMTAHGSSAFAEKNPLQLIWRDIHVGSRHAGFGMGIPHQLYGHALTGHDPRAISHLL